eukprot:687972-Prorocentrum_minimum.AAC.1
MAVRLPQQPLPRRSFNRQCTSVVVATPTDATPRRATTASSRPHPHYGGSLPRARRQVTPSALMIGARIRRVPGVPSAAGR